MAMVVGTDEQTQPKFKRIPKVGKGSGVLDERGVSFLREVSGIVGFVTSRLKGRCVVFPQ